jgi:hypothetical protein
MVLRDQKNTFIVLLREKSSANTFIVLLREKSSAATKGKMTALI